MPYGWASGAGITEASFAMNNEGVRKPAPTDRMLNQGFETPSIEPPVNGRGNSFFTL